MRTLKRKTKIIETNAEIWNSVKYSLGKIENLNVPVCLNELVAENSECKISNSNKTIAFQGEKDIL